MSKGVSIHVGVNYVDDDHHGISMTLPYCANDALAMQTIAEQNNFDNYAFLNEEATSYNLFAVLDKAAATLKSGDILFVSFSGHGCNFQDVNGDEDDGYDEGLIFYDRVVIDDELHRCWVNFSEGVRILFISDACYSGTVTKDSNSIFRRWKKDISKMEESCIAYLKNRLLYQARLVNIPKKLTPIHCSVLLLSACQDDQVAVPVHSQKHGLARLQNF